MLNAEAKVGAMSLLGLAALILTFFTLNNFQWRNDGYPVQAIFHQVDGLKVGSQVRVAGVDAGKVESLHLTAQGVLVTIRMNKNVQIPLNSKFIITSAGLMGDKVVEITPGQGQIIQAGQTVVGQNSLDVNQVMNEAGATLEEVRQLAAAFNAVVGQKEFQQSLQQSAVNLAKVMENLNNLTTLLQQMAVNNQADVRSTISNLNQMSANLAVAAQEARVLSQDLENDGMTAKKVQTILDNLQSTSQKASKIADDIQAVTGDQTIRNDLKTTISQAKDAVDKTNKMLGSFQQAKTNFLYEGQSGSKTKNLQSTVSLQVDSNNKQFYVLGLTNYKDSNKINVQLGNKVDSKTSVRAGLFKGFMGVALNRDLNKRLSLEGQLTNDENARLNLRTQYYFKPNLSFTLQQDNVLGNGAKETHIGLQQKF